MPSRPPPYRAQQRPKRRRGRTALVLLTVPIVLLGAELVRRGFIADARPSAGRASATPEASPSPSPSDSPSPVPSPSVTASPEPLLAATADYPKSGPQTWVYGTTQGPLIGGAGTLRRFRIAIETGVEGVGYGTDTASFGAIVDATLSDERSWIGGRQVRFQRVPEGAAHQFTIYLATGETAGRMCLAGGVDIRVGGVPYTSCRAT